MPPEPILSLGAGVLLHCDDCGQPMMAGLTENGEPQLIHAVPVCEAFTAKALGQVERWVRRLRDTPPAKEAK